jgi:EAL domain-containing protein (putative c-di-GMP-specific phosphodiesterase class I)/GGDEF domain-containing protein/DNA-binding NarL/FixJ family response regulator
MLADKLGAALSTPLLGEASGLVLVVAPAEEIAKRIESHLRNAGHPLRAAWISDLEDLEDLLLRSPPDLVLFDEASVAAPQDQVLNLCGELRPELPVILIGRHYSVESAVAALAAGAQDYASYEDPRCLRHLELVVVREFVKHQQLRSMRLTQERLDDYQSRHQQLTEGTADAVAHVQEGILASANPAFAHLLGHDDPADIAGQPLIDLVAADQQVKIKERLRAVLKGKHDGELLELVLAGKKGAVPVKAQLILGREAGESVIELLIRAEGGRNEPPTAHIAFGDRRMFVEALSESPAEGKVRGALLLRVDQFEALENRITHADAQEVVARVAEAVHARLGPLDQSFAFSTEEIAVLVQRANFSELEQFAEFLRKEIGSQVIASRQHEAQITPSIAVYPLAGQEPPPQVVAQLVNEVRRLSARGGNQIAVLGAAARAYQSEREEARKATQIRRALEDNRLKLAYQSIASLEGETRPHFDVLVRMVDETGKEYHASEFLPVGQKFNLMRGIDRWVVTRALALQARRVGAKDAAVLFLKLSEDTLKDAEGFIAWLKAQTASRPLRADEIVFEFRELVLQNHVRKAKVLTQALREMGAGLAVEHYGVGANSAQLLEHIPAGYLKFHASYTQKFSDRDMQRRLSELVEVAKQRKIKTIVCHVEEAQVMARLWQIGVNFIQGYHVQKPEVVLLASDVAAR